jgi:hypothetical protein
LPPTEQLQQAVGAAVQHDPYRQETDDMRKTIADDLMEQGALPIQRRLLLLLLRHKFPKLPARIVQRIEATEQFDLLDTWFQQALVAKKLGDLSLTAD